MSIDTLDYAKRLEAAGVARSQAEAHAEALSHAISDDYVTKSYLDAKLADLKTEIFKAMFTQTIAQVIAIAGLVFAAVKLLH
jgi:hypothetical protein